MCLCWQVDDLVFLPHEYLLIVDDTGSGAAVFICRSTFEDKLRWSRRHMRATGHRHNPYRDLIVALLIVFRALP